MGVLGFQNPTHLGQELDVRQTVGVAGEDLDQSKRHRAGMADPLLMRVGRGLGVLAADKELATDSEDISRRIKTYPENMTTSAKLLLVSWEIFSGFLRDFFRPFFSDRNAPTISPIIRLLVRSVITFLAEF